MSSEKRNFKDFIDKSIFNYTIIDNVIHFPRLYNMNDSNKIRIWDINLSLINNGNIMEITDDIILNYVNNDNSEVHINSRYGMMCGKITTKKPTIITKGKNIGKSNETNIITQGLIQCRNLYKLKLKSGYKHSIKEVENKSDNVIYPMALHIYEDNINKVEYPCYIQAKLDGMRMLAMYKNNEVILLSRRLHHILGFDNIKTELEFIFNSFPNIILDGELYLHGMSLQDISGIVRKGDSNYKNKLKYFVFDYIDRDNKKLAFKDRIEFLTNTISNNYTHIKLLDTTLIQTKEEGDILFKEFVENKYEGIIYKKSNSIYPISYTKEKRTFDYLKRKVGFDDEFEIIGFTSGINGKDVGAIIFIVKTNDDKVFNVVPTFTYETRYEMYKLSLDNFKNLYYGKYATIKYDDLSKDGLPLRAKMIAIRDYE